MKEILEKIILDTAREATRSENLNLKTKCTPEIIPGILKEEDKKNFKKSTFVFSSIIGLAVCLGVLTAYKQDIPEDVKEIISAITNVFGEFLKEAYNSELGISNVKTNKLTKTVLENFSK